MRWPAALPCLALLAGCATPATPPSLLIFGEQHDQPDQQRQVADAVHELAARGALAAVVLEMADRGRDTQRLPRSATPESVREALGWTGWPWPAYAAVVMNAVAAGVPVIGGNTPRAGNRAAMADATLDSQVPDRVREQLADAVRSGHCGLLAPDQEVGMVRVQIARDLSLASTAAAALAAAAPGQRVLMLTGAQHASRDRGVPVHLAPGTRLHVVMFGPSDGPGLQADERRDAVVTPRADPCEGLRERLRKDQKRSPTQPATEASAAGNAAASVPPAIARSGLPPPLPPTCLATKLTRSPALMRAMLSAVTPAAS